MIRGQEFHEIIEGIFGDVKGVYSTEQLQVNCPMCQERDNLSSPDGKFNLEINTNKRIFRCWKCEDPDFSGTLGKLIRLYGHSSDYELYKSLGGVIHSKHKEDFDDEADDDYISVFLPDGFISFSKIDYSNLAHIEAYKYLILNRKLDFNDVLKFRLGFCTRGVYSRRIIIPSFDINGVLNYFVGRTYDKNEKQTYKNPKLNKKNIIFNEYYINYDSVVFLVEGVFEMLMLPNSIPLLGKEINPLLFETLKTKRPYVVVALDPDANKNEFIIYDMLKNVYGDESNKVRALNLKGNKDLDEIRRDGGKEAVIRCLYDSIVMNDDHYFNSPIRNSLI